jgi:hypothetical protein
METDAEQEGTECFFLCIENSNGLATKLLRSARIFLEIAQFIFNIWNFMGER